MCDSITCCKKHNFEEKSNGDIILSGKEFVHMMCCLSEERNAICEDCGQCSECKKIIALVRRFHETEHEVRKKPSNYIVYLKFNKHKNTLELDYARIFDSLMEAETMKVFLF